MNLINSLKKLPIDLGQGNLRRKTKGKEIALSLIGRTRGTALDVGCREGHQTRLLESMGFIVTPIDVVKEFERMEPGTRIFEFACAENNRNPIDASGRTLTLDAEGRAAENGPDQ